MTFEKFCEMIDAIKEITNCSEDTGVKCASEIIRIIQPKFKNDPVNNAILRNEDFETIVDIAEGEGLLKAFVTGGKGSKF